MKANRIIYVFNIVLAAVIVLLGFGCKSRKTVVDNNSSNNNNKEKERKIVKPDQNEPIKVLYGVPMTLYRLRGVVTDENDQPLEDIRVTIKGPGDQKMAEAVTNSDGGFIVSVTDRTPVTKQVKITYEDLNGVYAADSTENASFMSDRDGFTTNASLEIKKQLKKK